MRLGDGHQCSDTALLVPRGELVEVDLVDGLVDQAALVVLVEHLAGDLLGRDERQLDHLAADLLDEPLVLGLDRLAVLLEPPLEIGVGLLDRALPLRLADAPGLRQDLLGLRPVPAATSCWFSASSLRDSSPRLVSLVERLGDAAPALRRSDPGFGRTRAS